MNLFRRGSKIIQSNKHFFSDPIYKIIPKELPPAKTEHRPAPPLTPKIVRKQHFAFLDAEIEQSPNYILLNCHRQPQGNEASEVCLWEPSLFCASGPSLALTFSRWPEISRRAWTPLSCVFSAPPYQHLPQIKLIYRLSTNDLPHMSEQMNELLNIDLSLCLRSVFVGVC